jgi:hypothetical protein
MEEASRLDDTYAMWEHGGGRGVRENRTVLTHTTKTLYLRSTGGRRRRPTHPYSTIHLTLAYLLQCIRACFAVIFATIQWNLNKDESGYTEIWQKYSYYVTKCFNNNNNINISTFTPII